MPDKAVQQLQALVIWGFGLWGLLYSIVSFRVFSFPYNFVRKEDYKDDIKEIKDGIKSMHTRMDAHFDGGRIRERD